MKLTCDDERVSEARLLRWAPWVRIWDVDLAVKYWEPIMYSYGDTTTVVIAPSERSLGNWPEQKDEWIELELTPALNRGRGGWCWQVEASISKYTLTVVAFRHDPLRWMLRKYSPHHRIGMWRRMRKLHRAAVDKAPRSDV